MTPEQFTYWLNGFFEISDTDNLNDKQVRIIRDHLDLVFNKVTPNRQIEKTSTKYEAVSVLLDDPSIFDGILERNYCVSEELLRSVGAPIYC